MMVLGRTKFFRNRQPMISGLLAKLFKRKWRVTPKPLSEWFEVTFEQEHAYMKAEPPGPEAWAQQFRWQDIQRICFKAEDMWISDGVYVYTSARPESYVIPTEAKGRLDFWDEVLRRGLYDAKLVIKAACSDTR